MGSGMKLKLLIVEDEYIAREALKRTVDWTSAGVELVGAAEEGTEAIEMIHAYQPDIVLTDVKMLGMDGLELSRWINDHKPHIKVVILSAFSDFEYAQKALKYGVVDYLVKPLDEAALFDLINRIRDEILRQMEAKHNHERIESMLTQNMPLLRDKVIHDVLEGKYEGDIGKLFYMYGIDLTGDLYVTAVVSIEDNAPTTINNADINLSSEYLKLELADFINRVVNNELKAYIFNEGAVCAGIIFTCSSRLTRHMMFRTAVNILEKARECFYEKGRNLTIGVSNAYIGASSLQNCYYEAQRALKARVYMGANIIIPYNSLNTGETRHVLEIYDTDNIFEYFKNYDWFNVNLSIRRYFEHYAERHEIMEKYPHFIIYELLSVLKRIMVYNQEFSETTVEQEKIERLFKCATLNDMYDCIIKIFKEYFNRIDEKRKCNSNNIITKVKEYINSNYMNDLSLVVAAEHVYLSTSYLSRLFLREAGISFSDYLTNYRIEKTRELLLKSDLKVYEISEKVGYHSEKYLIKQFKKIVGISPLEFKKNHLKH